jgi:anti-anti-sigma factor
MKASINEAEKIIAVEISGDLTSTNAEALRQKLAPLLAPAVGSQPAACQQFRLSLINARMVDSVGLNLIVSILRAVQAGGGKMQVCYGSQNVLRTFQFTRLDQHIELIRV